MLNNVLVNLKVISKIAENGKISTTSVNNTISIENEGYLTPLWRFVNGDSRKRTIESITDIIDNAIQISNNMIQHTCMCVYDKKDKPTTYEISEFNKQYQSLKILSTELQNSLKGLLNLKNTYKYDAMVTSQLEVLVSLVERQIIEIETNLEQKIKNKGEPEDCNLNNLDNQYSRKSNDSGMI